MPDNPFIERPDEHEVSGANELYCWFQDSRECNGSCVAFDPSFEVNQIKTSCRLLNNFSSISRILERGINASIQADIANRIPLPPKV